MLNFKIHFVKSAKKYVSYTFVKLFLGVMSTQFHFISSTQNTLYS